MYIVTINGEKHSAWSNREGARAQLKTLIDAGYKEVSVYIDDTVTVEDGHYYN